MSQRGGSVVTYVRMGEKVQSPLVEKGEADFIIAFEKLEALRWLGYIKKQGVIIVNEQQIDPMEVIAGVSEYPADIAERLNESGAKVYMVDAAKIAERCGTIKAVNIVMIGVLARITGIGKSTWVEAIKDEVPEKYRQVNLMAFEGGYTSGVLESDV